MFARLKRAPDFVIGSAERPYMRRWWIIPRNRWFNIYLHNVLRSDDDRALHDHPWWNVSIVLRRGYWEHKPFRILGKTTILPVWRGAGSIVFRGARASHRLEIDDRVGSAWTLFMTGPRIREWGFHCPQGWKHWRDFTAPGNKGEVGPGCGDSA